MKKGRNQYSATLKAQLVLEVLKEEKPASQIASENGIHPTMLSKWKAEAIEGLPSIFRKENAFYEKVTQEYEAKIEELYKQIGRLTTDLEWLKKKSGR